MEEPSSKSWFGGRWPDAEVPGGEPEWLYYEVDTGHDRVLRIVEVFSDGHSERNSLEIEARRGPPVVSLVAAPFLFGVEEWGLWRVAADEFERLWLAATDKPDL